MDIEFHYYMTYLIAVRAGFKVDDAYTIAYSSQYTDDNDNSYEILDDDFPYKNYISQTMDITKPKEELLRIHPYFHFFPGNKKEIVSNSYPRKDGKFQEAVKFNQRLAESILNPLITKLELPLSIW